MGAAISYVATIILINLLRVIELYLYENIQPFNKSYLKPIIAGFIVYMSMYLLVRQFEMGMFIELIVGSAVFVLLFFGLVWLFKLDKEDKYILEISFGKLRKSKT